MMKPFQKHQNRNIKPLLLVLGGLIAAIGITVVFQFRQADDRPSWMPDSMEWPMAIQPAPPPFSLPDTCDTIIQTHKPNTNETTH